MQVTLNGEPFQMEGVSTVKSLVDLRRPRPPFAVELNKTLVRRDQYDATPLRDGDCVEIVTLVGGG